MSKFNSVQINPKKKTVTVGAGATWGDIQVKANKLGWLLKSCKRQMYLVWGGQSAPIYMVGTKQVVLAETIRSITIINAQGNIQTLNPKDELFGYVVGDTISSVCIISAELELNHNERLIEKSKLVHPVSM